MSRRGLFGRWLGLTWLLGAATPATRVMAAEPVSKQGLDLTPMSEAEVEAAVQGFTALQQRVLTRAGTERAFTGETVNGYK
jgi:hypothetical protein